MVSWLDFGVECIAIRGDSGEECGFIGRGLEAGELVGMG